MGWKLETIRWRPSALWAGITVIAVAGTAALATIGVSAATGSQPTASVPASPRVHPGQAAANPNSCAGQTGVLGSFGLPSNLLKTNGLSENRPTGYGVAEAGPLFPTMVWVQAENFSTAEASLMSPRMPSVYARQHPTVISHVVESVQTFASQADATSFASDFGQAQVVPQVVTATGRMSMHWELLSGFRAGDQSLVTDLSLAEASVPSQIQIVLRVGDTVLTLEAVGGTQLRASDVESMALSALHHLQSVCGSSHET